MSTFPRALPRACLVLGLSLLSSGCSVGALARLDGEWPLPPRAPSDVRYAELGHGPAGDAALVRRGSQADLLVVQAGEARRVRQPGGASQVEVAGGHLFVRRGDRVLRRPLGADPDEAVEVARLEGLRTFRASPDGAALLLAGPDAVYLRRGEQTVVLREGDALALAWDAGREAVWVATRAPLRVLDCVRLADREVLWRAPLPLPLDSRALQVLLSGESVLCYAHDRPLEAALLLAPERGRVASLGRGGSPRDGVCLADAHPPLLLPPESASGAAEPRLAGRDAAAEGFAGVGADGQRFGRAAAFPGGGFLLVEPDVGALRLTVVGPGRSARVVSMPERWPLAVQALGWDEAGVTLVAGEDLLRVTPEGASPEDPRASLGRTLRRGVNVALNLPLAALEAAVYLPVNGAVSLLGPPVAVLGFALEPNPAWGLALVAPVWFPFATTFGLLDWN